MDLEVGVLVLLLVQDGFGGGDDKCVAARVAGSVVYSIL
jgi:hypothetical protein